MINNYKKSPPPSVPPSTLIGAAELARLPSTPEEAFVSVGVDSVEAVELPRALGSLDSAVMLVDARVDGGKGGSPRAALSLLTLARISVASACFLKIITTFSLMAARKSGSSPPVSLRA